MKTHKKTAVAFTALLTIPVFAKERGKPLPSPDSAWKASGF